MRILLDSNILFWSIAATNRLSTKAINLLIDPENDVWVSSISVAEFRIRQVIGKIQLPENFVELIESTNFKMLPFGAEHAHWLGEMPLHHRDPFDRMIIAQAIEENFTILTSDSKFKLYSVRSILN
jgi:PIN domain nuclease of toxin-antitoxin system